MPLVSIIMNVRNGAAFLREALDSVISQTFKDSELIVWDDCSTDNSAQIVHQYEDKRIRYFLSPEDTPLGKARDSAMQQARGEWLAFLDQDDIWLPRKLEKQIALAATDVGIIYGRAVMFDSRHGNLRDYDYAHEFTPCPKATSSRNCFADACFIAMSSAVLRRSAVEEAAGIPASIQVVPDYYLYAAVARSYQARAVQEVVCRYRLHAGSMSRSNRPRLHLEPLFVIDKWAECLDPKIVAYRRMTYSTALALEEMREGKSFIAGLKRLWSQGSWLWLLSRPWVRVWREVRRKLRRPYWLGTELASGRD